MKVFELSLFLLEDFKFLEIFVWFICQFSRLLSQNHVELSSLLRVSRDQLSSNLQVSDILAEVKTFKAF